MGICLKGSISSKGSLGLKPQTTNQKPKTKNNKSQIPNNKLHEAATKLIQQTNLNGIVHFF
jgi:hypothetical protein